MHPPLILGMPLLSSLLAVQDERIALDALGNPAEVEELADGSPNAVQGAPSSAGQLCLRERPLAKAGRGHEVLENVAGGGSDARLALGLPPEPQKAQASVNEAGSESPLAGRG